MVTGGAGFIGSHVIKYLLRRNDFVICVDNFDNYYDPKIKEQRVEDFIKNKNFKLYREDIRDYKAIKNIFQENKIGKVIHLAARVGVRNSMENPFIYEEVNINGTAKLLDLVKDFKINNFVFASSSSVYGNIAKIPFSENEPLDNPQSVYAATKRASELLCYTYHYLHGIPITCLRFFTVIGPNGRPDMAMFKFTRLISEDKEIPVYGWGKMKRSFTYISDIVDGIIASLDRNLDFEIINLGNRKTIELNTFIRLIENELGKKAKKRFLDIQPGEMKITSADCSKAERLLGFKPKVDIEEAVKIFVNWYKNQYIIKKILV